jgi:branched-chain amino acid aminotransferase
MGIPFSYSVDEIINITKLVVKKNKLTNGYVRPVVWRGTEDMSIGTPNCSTHMAVATWDWTKGMTDDELENGVRLCWAKWRRPPAETTPCHAKSAGAYMISTMSKNDAMDNGYHDAVLLDYSGKITESTSANIFFVVGGQLWTPMPDCFLNGITRQTIIHLANKLSIPVLEMALFPRILEYVQEVFICGTAAEITFVKELGSYSFTPGEISHTFRYEYLKLVNSGQWE